MAGIAHRVRRGVHVEPRPVHRQHRLPGDRQALRRRLAGDAVVDPERLSDRVRGAARPGRPLGGRLRAQARLPARPGHLRGRERGLRGGSLGLMLPEFEAEKRHVAIGVWAATGGIAAAAGPPLGGLLVQADWRWVFLVNVPVGLLGMITGARTLAERRELDSARPDVIGAGALIAAIGALVVAIVKGQEWGWGSPAIPALLVVTAVFLPAIWWRSERHVAPIVEPAMLRVRSFGLDVGASVLFFGGFGAMLLAGVLFLTS